jgi:hypothetical protein
MFIFQKNHAVPSQIVRWDFGNQEVKSDCGRIGKEDRNKAGHKWNDKTFCKDFAKLSNEAGSDAKCVLPHSYLHFAPHFLDSQRGYHRPSIYSVTNPGSPGSGVLISESSPGIGWE